MSDSVLFRGSGVFQLEDGGEYSGEFLLERRHGRGRETWPNGKLRYSGTYYMGRPHGQGIFGFEDGQTYSGTFCNGLKHWSGIYTDLNGEFTKTLWFHDEQMSSESCPDLDSTWDIIRGPMRSPLLDGFVDVIYADDSTYVGEIQNGVPHGNGEWASKDRKRIWKGEFEDESFKTGVLEHRNGWVSEGEFRETDKSILLHGCGKQTRPDGTVFEGDFRHGRLEGKGIQVVPSGERYEGEFVGGRRHGRGICKSPDGSVQEGEWSADEYMGPYKDTEGQSSKFRACVLDVCCVCQDDIVSGEPVMITECLHVFHRDCCMKWLQERRSCPICQGNLSPLSCFQPEVAKPCAEEIFKSGRMIEHKNGAISEGEFRYSDKSILLHGCGKQTQPDGTIYEGDFRYGVFEGKGIQVLPSGERYEGSFVGGKRHGRGICKSPDGSVQEGEWSLDEYMGPYEDSECPAFKFRVCALDGCSVCQDNIVSGEPVMITECMHVFHQVCCMKWLQKRESCPICQSHLSLFQPEGAKPCADKKPVG
jgi:hypothetical protein